jgi:hypothetical protein
MTQFAGIPPAEKLWLVRKLLEERTKQSLIMRWFFNVRNLDDNVVMRTAEGTIVSLVENYYVLREMGATVAQAFATIENTRALLGQGKMPSGTDLYEYVKYRVRLEHTRDRQMSDFEILRASSMTSDFIEKFFKAGPVEEDANEKSAESANLYFMSELPDANLNRPQGIFKTGHLLLHYYEHPRTIGSVAAGTEPPYKYPQVIVVSDKDRPLMIVRSEENALGGLFLCSLDPSGGRANWGTVAHLSRDDFVKKVLEKSCYEWLPRMQCGEDGRIELKTLSN